MTNLKNKIQSENTTNFYKYTDLDIIKITQDVLSELRRGLDLPGESGLHPAFRHDSRPHVHPDLSWRRVSALCQCQGRGSHLWKSRWMQFHFMGACHHHYWR